MITAKEAKEISERELSNNAKESILCYLDNKIRSASNSGYKVVTITRNTFSPREWEYIFNKLELLGYHWYYTDGTLNIIEITWNV